MHRATTILFCGLVFGALGYVMAHAYAKHAATSAPSPQAVQSTAPAKTATLAESDAGAKPSKDAGGTSEPSDLARVLKGGPVPSLPKNAPRSVQLGIILLTHTDAEFAPKKARSKREAHRLAKELVAEAKENFKEAVKKGDPGSTADAGTLPRGVLEAPLEYVVYTLEKGRVFDEPLDTPRGYWIVKRIH